MHLHFSNKVAVITGGGSGIGRAVAAAMARRDVAAVALVDVSEAVEDVAEKLNAEAGRKLRDPLPGRHDRRGVSCLGLRRDQPQIRPGVAVRAGRRHHPRRPGGAHRQGHRQGPHLPARSVQARRRREPDRPGVLGAGDDRPHRRGPRRQGPEALDARRRHPGLGGVHRLDLVAGQSRPDLLCEHQGRPRRRGGDDHEGGDVLRRALQRHSPRLHRHADGARRWASTMSPRTSCRSRSSAG